MYVKVTEFERVGWTKLAQNRAQCRASAKIMMELRVS